MLVVALFTTAKLWAEPKRLPTDGWIRKSVVFTMKYYSDIKAKTMSFVEKIDRIRDHSSK